MLKKNVLMIVIVVLIYMAKKHGVPPDIAVLKGKAGNVNMEFALVKHPIDAAQKQMAGCFV